MRRSRKRQQKGNVPKRPFGPRREYSIFLRKVAPQEGFEPTRLRASRDGVASPKLAVSFGERAEADNPLANRLMRVCYLVGSQWVSFGPDERATWCSGANCPLIVHWCYSAIRAATADRPCRP